MQMIYHCIEKLKNQIEIHCTMMLTCDNFNYFGSKCMFDVFLYGEKYSMGLISHYDYQH